MLQVARSEASMRRQLTELLLLLVFGLPLGVAMAGVGGYVLAHKALAPVDLMASRARAITADRLSDRLPVANPRDELGRLATVFNQTLERLESSFEQMRRFTADVSHELRTPLTAIRVVGEVALRDDRDAAAYRTVIGSMLEEVDRLSILVDRLLTLSRAQTGEEKLSREIVALADLAEEVVAELGVLAEEKQQDLRIEAHGGPRTLGDRIVLRQAITNLIDNAIKYTPSGGKICVRVLQTAEAAVLEVRDTGPGIPKDVQTHIFDRFSPASAPLRTMRAAGGWGLGLAIARWAVEANGGTISATSSSEGSEFRLTLPFAMPPDPPDLESRRRSVAELRGIVATPRPQST